MNTKWKKRIWKEPTREVAAKREGGRTKRDGHSEGRACRVPGEPGAGRAMCEGQCWAPLGTRQEARGLSGCMRDLDNRKGKIFRQWGLIDTGMCNRGSLWNFLLSSPFKNRQHLICLKDGLYLTSEVSPEPRGGSHIPKGRENLSDPGGLE